MSDLQQTEPYAPAAEYLERYADLLISYALGGGEGIKPGEVVHVIAPESAKPLFVEICRAVWRAGGHTIQDYRPDDDSRFNLSRDYLELASDEQLAHFKGQYWKGIMDQSDHAVYVQCVSDPHAMRGVDPARMLAHQQSYGPLVAWQNEKESAGRWTWTIGAYATEKVAAEAGLSLEEYWAQIIHACFLDEPDPKVSWRTVNAELDRRTAWLNGLPIDRLHVEGVDVDLWITLGEKRAWIGGGGRNIPSFEVFTSPDWRGTNGWIRFSEPLYEYGNLIKGIRLEFKDGRIVSATAAENEQILTEMVGAPGGDAVGEFSMTDARLSRITKFMADTLFDENVGGPYGNTHIAIGNSIHQCYAGDPSQLTEEEWRELGYNESVGHTDIVSTTDRTVTAVMTDGTEQVIYANGQFLLPD